MDYLHLRNYKLFNYNLPTKFMSLFGGHKLGISVNKG